MKDNYLYVKIFIAVIIFLSVFFSRLIKNIILVSVLAALAAVISYAAVPISEYLDNMESRKNRETLIKKYIKDLISFLKSYFEIEVPDQKILYQNIDKDDFDLTRESVYERTIKQIETNVDKNILLLLALTKEIDREEDISLRSRYKEKISEILSNFDTLNFDLRTQELMNTYARIYKAKDKDHKKLFLEFAHKYATSQFTAFQLFNDLKLANEFRKTLSQLIVSGKLSLPLVVKEAEDKRDELLNKKQVQRGFIVIMNKYEKLDSVKRSLSKFPQIEMGRLKPQNFPENTQYLNMRIVYPKTYYSSADEFLKREIINRIPEDETGKGFVAVLPLEITGIQSYPKTEADIESNIMKKSFQSINYLITGQDKSIDEIVTEYELSNISLSDILAVIPFNIFVPDIKTEAKNFIIDNYPEIEKKFGIKSLFDWANVNANELSGALMQFDKKHILTETEWQKIGEQICEEAQKHTNALLP